jgi:hypothetical protein
MLSKTSGPAVFGTIAAVLLVIGFVIAFVPSIKSGAVAIIAVIASIGLVAGGAAGAIQGEREMHHHETTGQLAAEGECDTPDETPADENASQAVAAKANIAAELTLTGDGTLEVENLGVSDPDAPSDRVSIPRSNVTNVLFTNESPEARRLVLDLGTRPEVDPATGDTVPDTEVPNQLCTQLAEEDGTQLLTFSINTPSAYAKEPYRFVVPGVDGAEVLVMVS